MILSDRDIFLLDEGTAGLDAETERKFVESLKEKYENKKTIVFITHHRYLKKYADIEYTL